MASNVNYGYRVAIASAAEEERPAGLTVQHVLAVSAEGEPGWSTRFGGPEGVAQLAQQLREELLAEAEALLELRNACATTLLSTKSLAEVGALLGISKQAVLKQRGITPQRYRHLTNSAASW